MSVSSPFGLVRCAFDDAGALALIGSATFLEAFAGVIDGTAVLRHCMDAHAASNYEELMVGGAAVWMVTCAPGAAPIGYAVLAPAALPVEAGEGLDLEIKRIYLLQRFQGRGLGRALMEVAEAEARARGAGRLLLAVYVGNTSAQAFYQRSGYREIERGRFTIGGAVHDGVVFAKALAGASVSGNRRLQA